MIEGHSRWADLDVEDILNGVESRTGYQFGPKERVLLFKALRLMWARGPGHDCPYIEACEVPPLFLPKRDWRQMDSDIPFHRMEPDRQRQVIRKKTFKDGGKVMTELQFEIYIRQQDIFYELKDIQNCVSTWMKSDPRKMLREDPREEAMKMRIRTMMDMAAGYMQVRKGVLRSRRHWGIFFLLCRLALLSMSILMFVVGYTRYEGTPHEALMLDFFYASGQFRSGTSFMLAFWVAFLVADRAKEDRQNRRFQRIIIALERLMEEISSFRVETDTIRMEEHEAVQRNESAQLAYEQGRAKKVEVGSKAKRRRKKKVDRELNQWAPGVKMDNIDEFKMKAVKAIEESFKRLPPLPDNFRRNGGDRMVQFKDKGHYGGVEESEIHVKAPWVMFRGEAQPTEIEVAPPSLRAMPLPRRPLMPPPGGAQGGQIPHLDDLRRSTRGETPPYSVGTPASLGTAGWDPEMGFPDDDMAPRTSLRDAMRTASGSLPASRAVTQEFGAASPRSPPTPPVPWGEVFVPPDFSAEERLPEPEVPPPQPVPSAKAARSRRRVSKDLAPPDLEVELEAGTAAPAAEGSDLRDAGVAVEPPPLPPPSEQPEQPP